MYFKKRPNALITKCLHMLPLNSLGFLCPRPLDRALAIAKVLAPKSVDQPKACRYDWIPGEYYSGLVLLFGL